MKKKKHYAHYGSVCIKRGYCKSCRDWALIVKGRMACCDGPPGEELPEYSKQMCETVKRRKKPSKIAMKLILEQQEGRCYYCDVPFGEPYTHPKSGRVRFTKEVWDHYVPYSYSQNNRTENFVASCQICNGIKTNKIFDSRKLAIAHVMSRREKLGYNQGAFL